jgi:heme exporter protein CcmD
MPDLGPHQGFILGAYALGFLILAAMIIGSLLQLRAARARLAQIEAQNQQDAP